MILNMPNGRLEIHTGAFLEMRSIGKFKKLIKLIDQYGNGSERIEIYEVIENFKASYEMEQKEAAKRIVDILDQCKLVEEQIDSLQVKRDRMTKGWKHYGELLKGSKAELRKLKRDISLDRRAFSRRRSLNQFYDKCLKLLQPE